MISCYRLDSMKDRKEKNRTKVEDIKIGREMAEFPTPKKTAKSVAKRLSKTHVDYWKSAIFKPTYRVKEGARNEVGLFSIRLSMHGRRELFALNTANAAEAAEKARTIWMRLRATGWESTLREFKPHATFVPPDFVTLGDYVRFIETNQIYSPPKMRRALSKIFTLIAGMMEMEKPRARYDARSGGLQRWRERLLAVRLADLTPRRLEVFKNRYLGARRETRARELAAQHTFDAYLRCAKSLFGPRMRRRLLNLEVKLPDPVPFFSAEYTSVGRSAFRYRSRINPQVLTARAIEAFNNPDKIDLLKIFLLALHVGLRRKEIDRLLWSQFDFEAGILRVENTEFMELKTPGSEQDLMLEPELIGFFKGLSQNAGGIFVINSKVAPIKGAMWDQYRAQAAFTELCGWLRAQGVNVQKPIHTLRKEFGKLISERMGLYAASLALRHSSVQVTATYYADDTRPKHTGLGKLLLGAGGDAR